MNKQTLSAAVEELAAIPHFPKEDGAKLAIASHIAKFCQDPKKLRWLVDSALVAMRKWEGIGELRGLYCTRYKPADGVEAWCNLPGYSAEEREMVAAQQIYRSPYKELPSGLPFEADILALAERKKLA